MMTTFTHYGTVSHGTMRNEDLIPRFLDTLRAVDRAEYEQFSGVFREDLDAYLGGTLDFDSEDAGEITNALFDALDRCAPQGYYFGSHPGDGSDYGFWPEQDR